MCYHYDAAGNTKAQQRFGFIKKSPVYTPVLNANGFSHPKMPVVTAENKSEIQLFEWGLLPTWVDATRARDFSNSTLNAKAETMFELAAFREAAKTRCLVLTPQFYEWRTEGKTKIPYQIGLNSEEVFAMGGIYTHWQNPHTGETKGTFSIVTIPANDIMAYVHNVKKRMPFILSDHQLDQWLDPTCSQSSIAQLMKPIKSNDMKAEIIKHEGFQYSLF
jgi:putative SOS response-associated peptidase YedK